jgi:preprotein translocase subunit SecB
MDKTKQPGIKFDGILLVKEDFWRDYTVPKGIEPRLNFNFKWSENDKKFTAELDTSVTLQNENGDEVLRLNSTWVGLFSIDEQLENMDIEEYLKTNSSALMIPYIREHISAITSKSGVGAILLPPINVLALIQSAKDSKDLDQDTP